MIIHIYNKNCLLLKSPYVPSIEEFRKSPKSYYEFWNDDLYVSEVMFDNPKFDNGRIREKDREELILEDHKVELLNDGEYIVEGTKIVKVQKPNEWMVWDKSSLKWVWMDLESIRSSLMAKFKDDRVKLIYHDILFTNGAVVQAGPTDIDNIKDVKSSYEASIQLLDLLEEDGLTDSAEYKLIEQKQSNLINYGIPWILKDNTVRLFKYREILLIYTYWSIRKSSVFYDYQRIYKELVQAKTQEELLNIKWVVVP